LLGRLRERMSCFGKNIFAFCALVLNFFTQIQCGSLLGRAGIMYTTTQNNFRDQQGAYGLVRMTNGFTLAQPASGVGSTHGASVYMDTCISVSGAIDLRSTNTIILLADLTLDNGVTFSSGGRIYGYDRALILDGDLTIPAGNVIHIGGRVVIDGRGNRLILGNRAQLFVDAGATLTLRNLVLQNTQNNPGNPPVKCAATGSAAYCSTLCLDDVELELVNDFWFSSGQMFINNDVAITGTSAFVYTSPQPSFITSGAKLYFDVNTTFSIVPATVTDCPYSTFPTTTTNNFIKMADQTSQLYLNGCTLCTTATGFRFTTGSMLFDNRVNLKSNSGISISTSNPLTDLTNGGVATGTTPYGVAWSPDGRYILTCNSAGTGEIQIFSFNSSSGLSSSAVWTVVNALSNRFCAWSPDGKYIAICTNTTPGQLQIYSFNSISGPVSVGTVSNTGGNHPNYLTWSPDGRFIAVSNGASANFSVYRFNGNNIPTLVGSTVSTTYSPGWIAWSPDGKFISISSTSTSVVGIFSFNGVSSPSLFATITSASLSWGAAWSPDGRYLAVNCQATNVLQIFSFNGRENPTQVGLNAPTGLGPQGIAWSPDGRFITVGNNGTNANAIQIFSFNDFLNPAVAPVGLSIPTASTQTVVVPWSPDEKFIAVCNRTGSLLQVFRVNYVSTNPNAQALSQSIVFGNSALGPSYDATVRGLAGTQMVIDGLINYDCVS